MKHPASLPNAEKPARNGIAEPVPNLGGAILVRYAGPTNSRGSRWIATLDRGEDCKFRAVVAFDYSSEDDGRAAAARAALGKFSAWANEKATTHRTEYSLTGWLYLAPRNYVFGFSHA